MIVLTGMHRSGTSLAALVMQALGADFGPADRLYGADDWNANGYLERLDVVDVNSKAITGFARTEGRARAAASQLSYLRMPSADRIDRRLDSMAADLSQVSRSVEGFVVKDPRFCLTLDGWRRHGRVGGLAVALRHPSASVASLRRRNRLPPVIGHRFWRWHMQAILPHIDGTTLVIRQDHLTGPDQTAEIDKIGRWLETLGVAVSGTAAGVVDSGLVHHPVDASTVPAENRQLWEDLLASPAWSG